MSNVCSNTIKFIIQQINNAFYVMMFAVFFIILYYLNKYKIYIQI